MKVMKCIVRGCENEADEGALCREHYDPEKKPPPTPNARGGAPTGFMNLESRLNLAACTLFLISGKLAGGLVRGYNNLFALTKAERARIFEHIGSAVLKKGRKGDSLLAFEKAVQLDPANPGGFRRLGDAYAATGDLEKARESYAKALELNPDYEEVHEALGQIYYDQKNYEAAVESLTRARTFAPRSDTVAYLLGLAYDKLGAHEQAIKILETAIDLNPREVKYYYTLGFVYDSKGMKDKALESFKKAVELEKGLVRREGTGR
jgi:tetratricopeptide (TPR) repeat protein